MPTKKEQNTSRSFKLAMWSFVCSVFFIFLGVLNEITVGSITVKFKMISSDVVLFLLFPSLSLYGFRRFTDYLQVKHKPNDSSNN